ncbi:carbohydrate-binding protein [Cohnella zeiphila]|uniref:Carbohydrate-binding protein n=1 Tax=Cohnella zeiphila TaxID=2761120 RepID=A0A7X0STY1_9BACL|nr:carbohydrate-binding protein [Cohnella zeiphila]MBB6734835.1 carbohydrate-binding protein [Cohnella zeiphila]
MKLLSSKPARWGTWTVAVALACSPLSVIGPAQASAFTSSDADTAIKAFNSAFWDSSAKYFWANSGHGNSYQGFWVEAELWETVMDAYLNTSDPSLKASLRTQIDDVFDGTVAKYGEDWTNNHFNDDIMWWAMASARAYAITKEQRYLDKAKYYFDFVYDTQWSDDFANGGIWWMNSDHSTKNACINFPAAEAAIFLYNDTKDEHYLDAAAKIFRWGKTMLTDGNGKVFDRIEVKNGAVPDATHYNQGTFIGAAVGLYQVTGNSVYLDDAVKAAEFTKSHLVDASGLLRFEGPNGDLKGGKTILMRNLAYLQKAVDETGGAYQAFGTELNDWLAFNTETAWSNRGSSNLADGNWAGQLLAGTFDSWGASGAVEALNVIKPQTAELHVADKDPYSKVEAESFNTGTGFLLEGSPEGTMQLSGIQSGFYAAYKNVDFGTTGAAGFIARAASGTGGGQIEIRLDSPDGPKVGTVDVTGTGGWNNNADFPAALSDDQGQPVTVTGKHDVYLLFNKTNDPYLFNLNWFKFTAGDPTRTDAYARLSAGNFDDSSGLNKNADNGYLDTIHDGAYASYKGIDFGTGAAGVTVRVSSGNQGGSIELKLDSPDGPTVGTVNIPAQGGWDDWSEIMAAIDDTQAAGVHDLYLIFHGADGSDYPCNLDWFSFTTVKGKEQDASGKIEAESYSTGVQFGTENGGGQTYLAGIYGPNNPYAVYNYINFGDAGPAKLYVNAASDTQGGTIEARLDSLNGPLISSVNVTGTGGWQTFQVFSGDVATPVTGKHIVYLLFKGSDYLFNLDKFTFGDPDVLTKPDEPPTPPTDSVAPGEVEHVQTIREDDQIRLTWDGPYDIDGTKTIITVLQNGQQIGEPAIVNRGIQTALLSGLAVDEDYTIVFRNVDTSGNVSQGLSIETKNGPSFSLASGGKAVKEGSSIGDGTPLSFQVTDGVSEIVSAVVTLDGKDYPASGGKTTIDLAGNLGDKTAVVELTDRAGNRVRATLAFHVVTSLDDIGRLLSRYAESGDLTGPLVPQLTNALDQARQQLDKGSKEQAVKHMEDFIKHLNNKALSDLVSAAAKTALNADAQSLLSAWK